MIQDFFSGTERGSVLRQCVLYLLTALFSLVLVPSWAQLKPGPQHEFVSARVLSLTTSTTENGVRYAPVLSFTSKAGQDILYQVKNETDRPLWKEGEEVSFYYNAQKPEDSFLEQDPLRASIIRFIRVLGIPFAVMGLLLLFCLFRIKQEGTLYIVSLVLRGLLPSFAFVIVFFSFLVDAASGDSFSFHYQSADTGGPFLFIAFTWSLWLIFSYFISWPSLIIRVIVRHLQKRDQGPLVSDRQPLS